MRRKADGTAFEKEFRDTMEGVCYVRRLPTLNTGYAGMTQPADFISVGDRFSYLELKETAGDSFSITSMEQFEEMKEFLRLRSMMSDTNEALAKSRYLIIVHFLKRGVIKVVEGAKAMEMSQHRKAIRFDDDNLEFSSLQDLKERYHL